MQTYKMVAIGQNRGSPRIWLEGAFPLRAGFAPGVRFTAELGKNFISLKVESTGERTVSKKVRKDKEVPIIDINSKELLSIFEGQESVRVVMREHEILLMPLASEVRRKRRLSRVKARIEEGETLEVGSLAFGGGVLDHAVEAGLKDAGIPSHLAFANEIRDDLGEHAFEKNEVTRPDTQMLLAPMQELAFDQSAMANIAEVDILCAGLPCSGASVAGRAKNKTSMPEEHPHVGHLVAAAIAIIAKVNPAVLILENVIPYRSSASAAIIRTTLSDMGYVVHEREFLGTEWGDMEARKRWSLVAVTRGIDFNLESLARPLVPIRKLSDVMEPIKSDDPRWSPMQYLKDKQVRDIEAGKGFRMQIFDGSEPSINTITKGVHKRRSTDPLFRNPDNPELLRIPTPKEHARCKGVPEHLIDGLSATMAHELLGQGICYSPFRYIGRHVGEALRKFGQKALEFASADSVVVAAAAG